MKKGISTYPVKRKKEFEMFSKTLFGDERILWDALYSAFLEWIKKEQKKKEKKKDLLKEKK